MSEEQIMQVLECCSNQSECKKECAYESLGGVEYCIPTLLANALELIKRKNAEIERLEGILDKRCDFCPQNARIEALAKQIEELSGGKANE